MSDRYAEGIRVVPYRAEWPQHFAAVRSVLAGALRGVQVDSIEHVGSTAVPGLPAKPILDIDIIVRRDAISSGIAALQNAGYLHRGDLGVTDREAFTAPDELPARNVYLCVGGTLHVRNHLAVRDTLRSNAELRQRYGAVKTQLASEPGMTISRYLAGKSTVLQDVLALSDLTENEKRLIFDLNAGL